MKILDAGHDYELDALDEQRRGGARQRITFVKREGERYPFNAGAWPGTNCQEVLRVLIDRCEYLNKQIPCAETEAAIGLLKSSLLLFEVRAARLHGRSLELGSFAELIAARPCSRCGHIGCDSHTLAAYASPTAEGEA